MHLSSVMAHETSHASPVKLLLSIYFTVLTPFSDPFDRLPQLITRALTLVSVQAVLCLLQLQSGDGDQSNSKIDSWRLFR